MDRRFSLALLLTRCVSFDLTKSCCRLVSPLFYVLQYLKKQGESAAILDDPKWPVTKADKVAAALLEWGKDSNATTITHWFQPLGSTMVRHGLSAQVHNNMFTFDKYGKPIYSYSGSALIRGESDGSSFPSGGRRVDHGRARAGPRSDGRASGRPAGGCGRSTGGC